MEDDWDAVDARVAEEEVVVVEFEVTVLRLAQRPIQRETGVTYVMNTQLSEFVWPPGYRQQYS